MTYEDAIMLAVKRHWTQTRWNGEPYVMHPLRVARNAGAALCEEVERTDAGIADHMIDWTDMLRPPRPEWIGNRRRLKPTRRRPFKIGEFVCRRTDRERIGQVIIPSSLPLTISRALAKRLRPRVKVFWPVLAETRAYDYEWIDEADLMSPDTITELGRIL